MNGGTGSRLPVRDPTIARPVSFHSLSDHNRKNPTYLSPYSHRRPRTPRSSPLAGPSLSSDAVDNENKDDDGDQKPRYRPNRISSIPDMVAPIQSLYDSDTISLQSPPSINSTGAPQTSASSSSSSSSEDDKEKELSKGREEAEDGSRLRNFAKRLSIISTSSLTTNEDSGKANKRRSLHSASTTSLASTSSSRTHPHRTDQANQATPPIPTIPRWALNAMREEAGAANRNAKYGHRRGTSDDHNHSSSLPPLPNQPIPRGVPLTASGLSNHPRPPSTSRDPTENWISMTDPIPKFSRLALRGEGVVLPVSKKESLAKMKSSSSINSTRSTATITQSTGTRRDSGTTTRTEPRPSTGSNEPPNPTITETNPKEEAIRKRASWAGSLKTRIPRISVPSSTRSENVPPLPPFVNQPDSGPAPVQNSRASTSSSNGSASKSPNTAVFPPIVAASNSRGSTTSRRDSGLAVIDERLPPPPLPNDPELGMRAGGVKSQNTQKTRARRKSIKQIVMRITTAPMSAGEKLKLGSIHKSNPVVVLPPDTLMPLDPPPAAWAGKPASSSVPSLHSTTETPEVAGSQGDGRGHKKFHGIKKKWNAVLATVRR